ncbi:conserved protein of unknown function [Bradyrhizobium vignae]|uniref:Uncharacterized protein n=1 Tax=Bradyrhizobium vignae TaxID=1549949 RepID=A0A2U3PWW4_9BRAD|nr:conserved protein of unknown function [Bradyrhizobium vignae]
MLWKFLAGCEGELRGFGRLVIGRHGVAMRTAGATGLGAGAEGFVDDRLDGPGTATAFGTTAEASVDLLGMAHGVLGLGDGGADIIIAQHVTGTNDHGSGRSFGDAPSSIFNRLAGCKRKNWYLKLFQTGPVDSLERL